MSLPRSRPDLALLVLRLALGLAFLARGFLKLFPIERTAGFLESVGYPAAGLAAPLRAMAEVVAGSPLVLGNEAEMGALRVALDVPVVLIPVNLALGNGWWEVSWPCLGPAIAILLGGAGARGCSRGRPPAWAVRLAIPTARPSPSSDRPDPVATPERVS